MKRRLVGGAEFGEMRICQNEGKEWFCLSDVCKALDLTTPAKVKQRLSERGMNIIHTPTYNQHGTMVMMEDTQIVSTPGVDLQMTRRRYSARRWRLTILAT